MQIGKDIHKVASMLHAKAQTTLVTTEKFSSFSFTKKLLHTLSILLYFVLIIEHVKHRRQHLGCNPYTKVKCKNGCLKKTKLYSNALQSQQKAPTFVNPITWDPHSLLLNFNYHSSSHIQISCPYFVRGFLHFPFSLSFTSDQLIFNDVSGHYPKYLYSIKGPKGGNEEETTTIFFW